MAPQVIVPHSMRIGQIFTVLLGFGLSSLAVGVRLYTKSRITRKFLSEDYCSFAGYLGLVAYFGLSVVIGKNGGDTRRKAYLSSVESIIYDPTIVFVKTSILLQYVTLFVVHRRNLFHYTIHFLLWTNVVFYVVITFLFIFQCKPREKLWLPDTPGHCADKLGRGILSAAINVVSDFLIFFLPLPVISRLQMPSTKKLRLGFVFGFGLLACVASVVRLIYSIRLDRNESSVEYQLTLNRQGLWAFAEISIGIIVGCMPLVHKFLKHFSSQTGTNSSFRIFGSSEGESSWRRLLGKLSSMEASSSWKFFGSKDSGLSKDSSSNAPRIGTLNMTRASLASVDRDFSSSIPPTIEKNLPAMPSAVHNREAISIRPIPHGSNENGYIPELLYHEEKASTAQGEPATLEEGIYKGPRSQPWQHHESTSESRVNETKRARYDLYPNT